jgi:hypothetical protein
MLSGLSLAAALPFLPMAAEGGDAMRLAATFPEIVIRKGQTLYEWPFSIEEGTLACISYAGQRHVFFSEILPEDGAGSVGDMKLPRMVVVTANPFAYFATFDSRDLYLPWDSLETLVKRLAPYERMGWALCDTADEAPPSDEL